MSQTTEQQHRPTDPADPADTALKARHRAMWALGDYPAVAAEVISALGPRLVRAAGVGPDDRVIDVAAGSGNASLPAAATGATVVAGDLTPDLLSAGRRAAAVAGLDLTWEEADAEALPHPDASFDVVLSCVGVMFAPHHQVAADELVRVCRPGGRIALLSWTPAGFIGRLFATLRPYVPAPPPGASPPPLWGDEAHVRALLGDRVEHVEAVTEELPVDRFATGAAFRDFFRQRYGPTVAAYHGLGDDTDRVRALDEALAELADEALTGDPATMGWEYLLLVARRA
ncbi:hypothetical protein ENKNEFLB_02747 [Nocardioides aquaticus]|uniref:Methyltransferase type 11 domain-containing protein n=1 Tax=Nocardioides aquaticus TaxID=160826 RepID=A0ABX8EIL0_9ACTN|nr:methyltransferase domain-containing protein [Nocardioides aquaticus]QVT80352.1 hypothetical protein ENKNEFLB_02747 [Nocardioides aquaticus]